MLRRIVQPERSGYHPSDGEGGGGGAAGILGLERNSFLWKIYEDLRVSHGLELLMLVASPGLKLFRSPQHFGQFALMGHALVLEASESSGQEAWKTRVGIRFVPRYIIRTMDV